MSQAKFKRTLVENVVERSIQEIQLDPKRSVRKLVDLGADTAKGPYQAHFLKLTQQLLEREDSPYYDLVKRTVDLVDHEKLKTFSVNLGWNGLTLGAEHIRKYEAANHHNVPWSLTLHVGGGQDDLPDAIYQKLVLEGKAMGIYNYFLFPDDTPAAIEKTLAMVERERECDFFLFIPGTFQPETELMEQICRFRNLLIGVDTSGAAWRRQAESLREAGCIYALYKIYHSQGDVEEILSGRWAEEIMPWAGAVTVCIAGAQCPDKSDQLVHRYALDTRLEQRYPTLMMDYYLDILNVDVCISSDACFLGVRSDGSITEFRDGHEVDVSGSVREAPLADLLRRFAK